MIWDVSPDGLFSAGGLIFITVGVVCAYIRWTHMCRPFNEEAGYFYPARKLVTLFYSSIVLTFPYVLAPMNPAVWLYACSFNILYFPVCFAILISRYFQLGHNRKGSIWWKVLIYSTFIPIIALLIALLFGHEEWIVRHETELRFIVGVLGVHFTALIVKVLDNLKKAMDRSNTENYSNDEISRTNSRLKSFMRHFFGSLACG